MTCAGQHSGLGGGPLLEKCSTAVCTTPTLWVSTHDEKFASCEVLPPVGAHSRCGVFHTLGHARLAVPPTEQGTGVQDLLYYGKALDGGGRGQLRAARLHPRNNPLSNSRGSASLGTPRKRIRNKQLQQHGIRMAHFWPSSAEDERNDAQRNDAQQSPARHVSTTSLSRQL